MASTKKKKTDDELQPGEFQLSSSGKKDNALELLGNVASYGTQAGTAAQQKNYVGATLSGAASGASLGSMIAPGWGTAIGGALGGIAGAVGTALAPEEKEDPLVTESKRLQNELMQQKLQENARKSTWGAKFRNRMLMGA